MAVPLSPDEVTAEAQRDFQASIAERSRAVPRHRHARILAAGRGAIAEPARLFDRLGLAEYAAVEGFVQWKGDGGTG